MKVNDDMDWPLDKALNQVEPIPYDLAADPEETRNLALDLRYREVAQAMRHKLEDILIRDGRIEVDWSHGLQGKVYRIDAGPLQHGRDDKKLALPKLR